MDGSSTGTEVPWMWVLLRPPRGSPWENGYIESFNARLRDELLDGEIFYSCLLYTSDAADE